MPSQVSSVNDEIAVDISTIWFSFKLSFSRLPCKSHPKEKKRNKKGSKKNLRRSFRLETGRRPDLLGALCEDVGKG